MLSGVLWETGFPSCGWKCLLANLLRASPASCPSRPSVPSPKGCIMAEPKQSCLPCSPLSYAGFPSPPQNDKSCHPRLTHEIQEVFWGTVWERFSSADKNRKGTWGKSPFGQPRPLTLASLLCLWMKWWCLGLQDHVQPWSYRHRAQKVHLSFKEHSTAEG